MFYEHAYAKRRGTCSTVFVRCYKRCKLHPYVVPVYDYQYTVIQNNAWTGIRHRLFTIYLNTKLLNSPKGTCAVYLFYLPPFYFAQATINKKYWDLNCCYCYLDKYFRLWSSSNPSVATGECGNVDGRAIRFSRFPSSPWKRETLNKTRQSSYFREGNFWDLSFFPYK